MYELSVSREPYWMNLARGVEVYVRPPSTMIYSVARAKAKKLTARLLEDVSNVHLIGLTVEGLPDLEDETEREGVTEFIYVCMLFRGAVIKWKGVVMAGTKEAVEMTDQTVGLLLSDDRMSSEFTVQYHKDQLKAADEGNGSSPSPDGTSGKGRAEPIAEPVSQKGRRVRRGKKA